MTIPLNRIQPHRPMLRCGLSGGDILKYSQTLPLGFVGKGNSAMAGFSPSREKRKRRVVVCELCYNSHPVIIFRPPSMIIRCVWASLGFRPESVWNPVHLIGPSAGIIDRLISRFIVWAHESVHRPGS